MPSLHHRSRLWLVGAAVVGVTALLLLRPSDEPLPEPVPVPPSPAAARPVPAPAFVPAPMPAPPQPVAAGTAGLQLKGVLGFHGGTGAAIFELPDGRQRRVAVGGEVVPGARLEAIGADRATIHDGVQRREFVLPELRSDGAPPATAMLPQGPDVATADARRDPAGGQPGLGSEGGAARPQGYRLTGAPPPALEGAGLRPGDRILAVNGQPLDQQRLLELPAEVLAAPTVTIDFERDGERMSTTLSRNQPASDIRTSVR